MPYIVSRAGDVDGEGHDDLLIGAGVNGGNDEGGLSAGAAYLVLGPVTGTLDLSLADAKFVGEEERDFAGASVSNAGDVDGNGNDDLLVGAGGNDEGRFSAGAAYLVLGPTSGTLDLAFADAKLVGEAAAQDYAHSVSSAGDADRWTSSTTYWWVRIGTTKVVREPEPPTWFSVRCPGPSSISPAPMQSSWVNRAATTRARACRTQGTWTVTASTTCSSARAGLPIPSAGFRFGRGPRTWC